MHYVKSSAAPLVDSSQPHYTAGITEAQRGEGVLSFPFSISKCYPFSLVASALLSPGSLIDTAALPYLHCSSSLLTCVTSYPPHSLTFHLERTMFTSQLCNS